MLALVLASCFAQALGVATGRECDRARQSKRETPVRKRGERERVREGSYMALALLCGTFDMSFEPSLITGAKTNTWAEKSYVLFESLSSSHFPLPPDSIETVHEAHM